MFARNLNPVIESEIFHEVVLYPSCAVSTKLGWKNVWILSWYWML